jgi:hypothetical protein
MEELLLGFVKGGVKLDHLGGGKLDQLRAAGA